MLVLLLILLASVNSFLLDNPQGNGDSATTNQYLTLSKFYEEMKLQQQDTTKLRHDTDNSLTLLTSQLQQKFDLLDKKLADIERQNETILNAANLEKKYEQLEQKYLNLEQNFNALKIENNVLRNDRDRMENDISSLRNETTKTIAGLKNKSLLVEQNIENLKHLGSIKPLQELQILQQEVKSISSQTSFLNMTEQARSQDLIALYNRVQEQGVISNRSVADLGTRLKTLQMNHNTSIQSIAAQIDTLQTNHTTSITDLGTELKIIQKNQSTVLAEIESKMHDAFIRDNQTLMQLKRQIDTSSELVLITAHPTTSTTLSGIIKFGEVQFSAGVNNLSTFKSTGKFVVEKEGLYLISVSIRSDSNDAYFYIYLNDTTISYTMTGYNSNGPRIHNTGSIVLALQLRPNDSVWVYFPGYFVIAGGVWSTLTIVKL